MEICQFLILIFRFVFGGDGVRGLEFQIGDILDKKCNIFIDNKNEDSENSRFNAAASIKAGIKYVIIVGVFFYQKICQNKLILF